MNRILATAFETWAELVATARHNRRCVDAVARRWANKSVFSAIATWLEAVRTARHQRHVLQKAVSRMANRCGADPTYDRVMSLCNWCA